MDEKLRELKRAEEASRLDAVLAKVAQLEETGRKQRDELAAERKRQALEVAALREQLQTAKQPGLVVREAPLQAARAPEPRRVLMPAKKHHAAKVSVAAPVAVAKEAPAVVAKEAPLVSKSDDDDDDEAPPPPSSVKPARPPAKQWTAGHDRLGRAVKVTWGDGPAPTRDEIRNALVPFGLAPRGGNRIRRLQDVLSTWQPRRRRHSSPHRVERARS